MWLRCDTCGNWCYAKKSDILDRTVNSVKNGDRETGDYYGAIAEKYLGGYNGLGKTIGRGLNLIDIPKHAGEMFNGDDYHFCCSKCGNKFSKNDERLDMTTQYDLYKKTESIQKLFNSIKHKSQVEKESYIRDVEELLASVANTQGIKDVEAVLHNILACSYYYFDNNQKQALLEINMSLDLCDEPCTHVLKGLFMGNVENPNDSYTKMAELVKIKDCDQQIPYIEKSTVLAELEQAEINYSKNFIDIPSHQRKFLVITDDYFYLPESFKVIKYDGSNLSGIMFKNGYPSKNTIYICHPYNPYIYYPSESYQEDIFENQLNELRELLQCLGAKSIEIENLHNQEREREGLDHVSGKIGGEYKGIGLDVSASKDSKNANFDSLVKKTLIEDGFSFNPSNSPFVPNELIWFPYMEQWKTLARMRLRGQNHYSIVISQENTSIVNSNEAYQVNADFDILVAKGNLGISKSSRLKASQNTTKKVKIKVEFYPLDAYHNDVATIDDKLNNNTPQRKLHKNYLILTILGFVSIIIFICVIAKIMLN